MDGTIIQVDGKTIQVDEQIIQVDGTNILIDETIIRLVNGLRDVLIKGLCPFGEISYGVTGQYLGQFIGVAEFCKFILFALDSFFLSGNVLLYFLQATGIIFYTFLLLVLMQ